MKNLVLEFIRRGLLACGFGPMVLVVIYLTWQYRFDLQTLTVNEVCLGVVTLSVLAFIVGGANIVYQIEQLPLMVAISIHASVLYCSYLITYLLNGWLEWGIMPILVFSGLFILCYLVIWMVIYTITKRNTAQLNEMLKQSREQM